MATWRNHLAEMANSFNAPFVDPIPINGDNMAPPFLVTACCRYLSLRAGSLVIAYYYLVAALVMSTTIIAGEAFLEAVKRCLDEELHHRLPKIEDTEGIMLGLWFLMLPFIAALLVGLHEDKAIYVKIFLLAIFAYILLEITMFFCCTFFYKLDMYLMAARAVAIVMDGCFFVIVRSQYYKMIQVP